MRPNRSSRRRSSLNRAVELLERRLLLCANDGCPDPVAGLLPSSSSAIVQPATSTGALYPLTAIPALNSDPGAPATLYLDFHGEGALNWDGLSVPATPAYDIDGDPTTFSSQELSNIQQIWSAVAEAYSPFNVNVTTVDPGNWSNGGQHQLRDVIGGNGSWTGYSEGGTAYVGGFSDASLSDTAFVFSLNLTNGYPAYTAIDAVHEAGHGFGLNHQSVYSGATKTNEYNPGNGTTAPFMGNAMNGARATWWDGQSSLGYNVIQDDVAVLTQTLGLRPENVGHTPSTASPLSLSGTTVGGPGIVESLTQQDYYSFTTAAGTCTFNVNVAQYGPMLHAILELHDANNNIVATANNASTLSQTITANLAAGQYYLVVKSYGQYGDLGQYSLSGTLATAPVAPTLSISGAASVNEGSLYTLNLSASDPGHTITSWSINWGDGSAAQSVSGNPSSVTHTYSAAGSFTISASATDDTNTTYPAGNTQPVSVLTPSTGASATFLRSDTSTQGTWNGVYGTDGYWVEGGSYSYPPYSQVSASGYSLGTWASPTTDVRAPQTAAGATTRTAGRMESASGFTINLNLTDGKTHQIALYLLDWDNAGRAQTVTISDAATGAVLSTQSVSSFQNGQWLVWNLSGNVNITFTRTAGPSAVLSALMFGGTPGAPLSTATASLLRTDSSTQGTWNGVYGTDGYWVEGGSYSYPAYSQVSATGYSLGTWASSTTDVRAPQSSAGATTRTAGRMESASSFTIDLNLTDGKTHQIALYMLDWDNAGRAQTVTISDAATGAVLSTQSVSSFQNGQWAVWNISGHVKITFTRTAGPTAVLSALMFGGVLGTSATFLRTDTTTQGTWNGVYGADGYWVEGGNYSYPAYSRLTASGYGLGTWASSTTDVRAPQTSPGATTRVAGRMESASSFTINLNLTDGKTHQIGFYLLDWDNAGRSQTVTISDAATGAVLSTQSVSNFQNGQWLLWNLSGNVNVTFTRTAGPTAVLSALMFG